MRKTAADRPAVADRTVGDAAGNKRHQPEGDVRNFSVLDLRMSYTGADRQEAVLDFRPAQVGQLRDIDKMLGLRQS